MESRELYVAEFDELNTLGEALYRDYEAGKITKEEVCEQVEAMLIHAYRNGFKIGSEDLEIDEADIAFAEMELSKHPEWIQASVEKKIDGKTFKDRVEEHLEKMDGASSIGKVLASEYHRDTNEGIFKLGKTIEKLKNAFLSKTWVGVMDERERDTHVYLEGMTIPLDSEFYTYTGDHALYPGMFGNAEEDVNCRCTVKLKFRNF